ncbi:PREDICTED: WD repeat-containing protein 44-like [Lupinus angustifolius]|uniref:WD repeat-containing protein 44-like n=1 Tax=Lupinus angustifolius TaxID=3871 RepID=UPI00092E5EE2|nr:PREDICTED: WD repeat-containing protein 44-like [Lupinus angustifolius]XP_019422904.1 PREDICTED: WD repeat-containing protein 44-like [Lupinus angustifolius]
MVMEEGDDQFYDTRDEFCSVSYVDSDFSEVKESSFGSNGYATRYQVWTNNIESVHQRRLNFVRWIGLESDSDVNSMNGDEDLTDPCCGVDRITASSGAVLGNSGVVDGSSQIVLDSLSNEAAIIENRRVEENFACMIKNLDDGTQYVVDKLGQDGMLSTLRVVGSNQLISLEEFQRNIVQTPLVWRHLQRNAENPRFLGDVKKKTTRVWLKKLRSVACVVNDQGLDETNDEDFGSVDRSGIQRVRVYSYKKQIKELTSLHTEQEFKAHKGVILTMKFSLDGKYLASGGKDSIVRVWKVVEDERSSKLDIRDNDPSSTYFKMNSFSCLVPVDVDKEKLIKTDNLKRSSGSTCVIIPPKTFRISEKPLHEFCGHSDDILDIAWSKSGFVLSSSVDKTVRLWQVGIDRCLRVFSHNSYVTCVNFNPVNDNIFISGSIDGKVRIWDVICCRVVDYIDIREVVTVVCFHPHGKGTIVGTMTGNCRFYDIEDNHLQLNVQLSLRGKKKTPGRRITSLEFSPNDPSKLLVSSADSHVCILSGVDVVYKFKGPRIAGQMHASFTSDGKHVVSVTEDSNVCIWNYTGQDRSTSKAKKIWSSETFLSHKAAIAIPWCGIESTTGTLLSPSLKHNFNQRLTPSLPDFLFSNRGFLSELLPKVSPTWPEETLPGSTESFVAPTMCKSEYKFLRSACKGMSNSHLWGQVFVTAGWDGCIRVYQNYGLPIRG